ncbi:hypothetical protein SLEP1_g8285 [Rubroshorea leprosula]|uniref:Uncharacterized protein n=1 Tax=Rubroshorea leprosula TaxID=152421 RepID=A0AAV5IB24_9ROSI|nr:hypothetical protein SLEP1_g8285 [Rubroshorea leprosula]
MNGLTKHTFSSSHRALSYHHTFLAWIEGHTGLCSKGTSISKPGSQLWPWEWLVPPSVSSLKALTESSQEGFCVLWYLGKLEP